MDPVSAQVTVQRPIEEVFAYLEDVANAPEVLGHFLVEWHLTREETVGTGAGVRFRVKLPFDRFARADASIIEVRAPRRMVIAGRGGKYNRILLWAELTLAETTQGTDVSFTVETDPKYPSDRAMELLSGQRARTRRALRRAATRLRDRLEDGEVRGERIGIAGGARKPATGFRLPADAGR